MTLENLDQKTLRKMYTDYIKSSGRSVNTANTTAAQIFALWNQCGRGFFWKTMKAPDAELRDIIRDFVHTYYPKQERYLSGYMTSLRYFRSFLASDTEPPVKENPAPQKTPIPQASKKAPRKTSRPVLTLTNEMLEDEHQKVLVDPGYGSDITLIDSILHRFPDNTDPELVALKIALINTTNSTHIELHRQKIVLKELTDIIVNIQDFDTRLRQGDPSLVPILAKTNGKVNFFSFATKYCTYHSVHVYGNDDYAILDSVVQRVLPKYVSGLHYKTITDWVQSYDYTSYLACIDELLDANGIDIPFRRRKLDHYLWHTYRKEK